MVIIHCCNQRKWYVKDYLVPSLRAQGIEDIYVYNDDFNEGCLKNFINCCKWIVQHLDANDGCWHLQDDVVICNDFAERIKETHDNETIINGFATEAFAKTTKECVGKVDTWAAWLSFPCVYIPNKLIDDFIHWFELQGKVLYRKEFETNKMDDFFFYRFIKSFSVLQYRQCYNLIPNLVNHIDYLLGGSTIRTSRKKHMALYWEDDSIIKNLEEELNAIQDKQ